MNTNNQSFMVQADLITLQEDKTIEKIAYKLLINLFSKGNNNAYDIAINRNNGLVTIEDLTQTMYLFLLERPNDWYLYRTPHRYSTDEVTTKLVFFSDDSSWATYNDSENHDAYDRVCILYEALICMQVNVDLSIEFIAMPKFENIEYILIKEIFESKDSKFFDNDNKKMERYKELLINNL